MNIKGSRNREIDTDLLGKLALKQQSGETISQSEVKQVLSELKAELKDEFSHSTRGLAQAGRAIENTLKLAVDSGWVQGDKAAQMIEEFLGTTSDSSLDNLLGDIRQNKQRTPTRVSYSRGSSSSTRVRTYTRTSTPVRTNTVRRPTVGT